MVSGVHSGPWNVSATRISERLPRPCRFHVFHEVLVLLVPVPRGWTNHGPGAHLACKLFCKQFCRHTAVHILVYNCWPLWQYKGRAEQLRQNVRPMMPKIFIFWPFTEKSLEALAVDSGTLATFLVPTQSWVHQSTPPWPSQRPGRSHPV